MTNFPKTTFDDTEFTYRLGDVDMNSMAVSFLECVPNTWGYINGVLIPRKSLEDEGLVLRDLRVLINDNGVQHKGEDKLIFKLLHDHSNPYVSSQVTFNRAGQVPSIISLQTAKDYAIEYMRRGFVGNLTISRNRYKADDRANFRIRLSQDPGKSFVKFSYNPDDLSSLDDIIPFSSKIGLYKLERVINE